MSERKYRIFFGSIFFLLGSVLSVWVSGVLVQSLVTTSMEIEVLLPGFSQTLDSLLREPLQQFVFFSLIGFLFFVCLYFALNSSIYQAKKVRITPEIEIPIAAGQNQHGSARFLTEKEKESAFDTAYIDYGNKLIKELVHEAEIDKKMISGRRAEALKGMELKLFEKGGIVVGMKSCKSKEKLYFIGKDVHAVILGATRSGKTRTAVIQTICTLALAGENMVIPDAKVELYYYTSRLLKRLGYEIFMLDFSNPLKSSCYNFLQPVINFVKEEDLPKAIEAVWDIVQNLVPPNDKGEKIWQNGEASIIACGIMLVVFDNQEKPEFQNLSNAYFFIAEMCKSSPDKENIPLYYYMKDLKKNNPNHPALGLIAISEIAPSRTRGSFYTSALTTLKLFTNPMIAHITSSSDFDLSVFGEKDKKVALFIALPDYKTTYHPFATLVVAFLYETLCLLGNLRGGRLYNRCHFILEEFGNFAAVNDIQVKLTVGGGRGIRFYFMIQSFAQLDEKYSKEVSKIIRDNCETWVFIYSDNPETVKEISEKMGNYTTLAYSRSESTQRYSGSTSASFNLLARPLLTTEEISKVTRPYSLVISRGHPVIMMAPDLSKWHFNKILGLGDEAFNILFREYLEKERPILIKSSECKLNLWGIWHGYQLPDKEMLELRKRGLFKRYLDEPEFRDEWDEVWNQAMEIEKTDKKVEKTVAQLLVQKDKEIERLNKKTEMFDILKELFEERK